ncbi:MAG TPA: hypothetical protein VF316_22365 [Polyangiaceae bacterium]
MSAASLAPRYTRRHPETTTLYAVVRDNLETLYGAVEDGALGVALPAFVRAELEGYLACGLLCHRRRPSRTRPKKRRRLRRAPARPRRSC